MGRLTTHVLDTALGRPAAGLTIELFRIGATTDRILVARTNSDGRVDRPLLEGEAMKPGVYELRFHAGDYLKPLAKLPDPPFLDVVPVSAEKGVNLDRLVDVIAARMPESPELFPPEQRTDRSEDFRITETIREKLTMELVEEVPYGIAVEIEKREEVEGRLVIDAVIWVDREGQKPIVIGAKGSRLKRIGQKAREELNARLGKRLHLNLWVKVREDWADDARALQQLGME